MDSAIGWSVVKGSFEVAAPAQWTSICPTLSCLSHHGYLRYFTRYLDKTHTIRVINGKPKTALHRSNTMGSSYFLARILIACIVPLTLVSMGPTESHPELGTDMATAKRKSAEVYRADDVQTQAAVREYQKKREVVKLQAYRSGQRVHFKRRDG